MGITAVALLFWARPAFPARRSPGRRWATFLTLLVGMLISIALAILLAEAYNGSLAHPFVPVLQGLRAAFGLDTDILTATRGFDICRSGSPG